ncbi:ABC transporter permease [Roseomonas sp. NAR14]|uniref:ABC transporter permease n=1 Tax=Roseomonas acroporae TaxID=2937791 RepID=A0A9X1Y531_9PROT|nr:ABC transporter permease [Roseomonas acroporae]MCK8784384.1 ABC transporter permease [Roseomonas acroporae]
MSASAGAAGARRRRRDAAGTLRRWGGRLLVLALLAYVLVPVLVACVAAFDTRAVTAFPPRDLTLRWFAQALAYEDFRAGAANGAIVSLAASTLALAIGAAAAYAIDRYRFPGRRFLEALLAAPLIVPHFVLGLGALILVASAGLPRGFALVIAVHVVLVLPFVIRSVHISLRNADRRLEDAAMALGARPWRVLWTVTLPSLAPGLAGGWLFAAVLSFNEFTASLFVTSQRTQTLPVAMYNYVREYADPSMAALSALYILATAALLILADRLIGLGRVLGTEHAEGGHAGG